MILNRAHQPALKNIDKIDFIAPEKYRMNDQVSLYHMKEVANETSRIDLYFDAGKCKGSKGIAGFVSGLLLSGTATKSSTDINNEINGLGGFYESGISVENSVITIYCLRENLAKIFDTLMDAIQNVAFIEKEVKEFLSDRKQRHRISMEKVSYLAQRAFQKQLFSSNDAYSSTLEEEDFDLVSIDELKEFHAKNYLNGLTKVVVVGNVDNEIIQKIISKSVTIAKKDTAIFEKELRHIPGLESYDKKGAVQCAIRVGRILFNKNHETDYLDFLILNTILGDYFGSRLMSNIREDKGYTYGIGSMLAELNETGYFMIATEVGKDVKDATLKEIRHEFECLQKELVSEEELTLIRNYMLGQLLKSADGPYAMTDLFLSVELHGQDLEHYNRAIVSIYGITPERIRDLAKNYLNWDEMCIYTAG